MDAPTLAVLTKDYPLIEQALRDGFRLRGFRTGSGLRKFELFREGGDFIGIPQSTADSALQAIQGWLIGNGFAGVTPPFITGARAASSQLDEFVFSRSGQIAISFAPSQDVFVCKATCRDSDMHPLELTRHGPNMVDVISRTIHGCRIILEAEH